MNSSPENSAAQSASSTKREPLIFEVEDFARAREQRERDDIAESRERCATMQGFLPEAWRIIEPATPYMPNWHADAICEHLEAVFAGQIRKLLINVPFRTSKSTVCSVAWPAYGWTKRPAVKWLTGSYALKLAIRDSLKMRRLITSPWYLARWGDLYGLTDDQNQKVRFENDKTGYRITYGIDAGVMGDGGDYILLDDPHDRRKAHSDVEREGDLTTFDEAITSRRNQPGISPMVVIMQRLHCRDMSGHLMDKGGWEHLLIPMHYDPKRSRVTCIGWKDPRTEAGELMHPARFGAAEVAEIEDDLGPYACTPSESPVLMADLSLKPISDVRVGDAVVGWKDGTVLEGCGYARQQTAPSRVLAVHRYRSRPVVRLVLDSGEIARCTPDHRWYKRKKSGPPQYGTARLNTPLVRLCPSALPELTSDEQRMAGWLAGFYDGEGSVSFAPRRANASPVASIKFYQGAGRNLPLCDKLESILGHFGFQYGYSKDERKDPTRGVNFEYRAYTLRGKPLPLMQRFLHIVQPVKWRDRMIAGAYGAHFCQAKERVVSIEPDGAADVYALTTETGNYVVWGLASSNSAGQLEQSPVPEGGAMMSRVDFKLVPAAPAGTRWIRGWDLAGSIKKTSPWTSGVKIGEFRGAYYVGHVTRERRLPEAVESMIINTTAQDGYGCEVDLPQDPGQAGKAQVRSLVKQLAGYVVHFSPETGAKPDRARPFAAQVKAGNVYLVEGPWNEAYLQEAEVFPFGAYLDQIDATSRGFARLLVAQANSHGFGAPKILRTGN